jgi:hypothetical protein
MHRFGKHGVRSDAIKKAIHRNRSLRKFARLCKVYQPNNGVERFDFEEEGQKRE